MGRGQTGKQKIEYQKRRKGCYRKAASLFAFADAADFEKSLRRFFMPKSRKEVQPHCTLPAAKTAHLKFLCRASPVLIGTKTAALRVMTATLAASIARAGSISFACTPSVRINRAG